MNERIKHLEEKIAYLERHVTEQDRAMLEFADELAGLRREMKAWRERTGGSGAPQAENRDDAADDRPPHY